MEENNHLRDRSEKSYRIFRSIYDFSMAEVILGSGILMLFAKYLKLDQILNVDAEFRAIFGTLCMVYGTFRLYRGFKKDY